MPPLEMGFIPPGAESYDSFFLRSLYSNEFLSLVLLDPKPIFVYLLKYCCIPSLPPPGTSKVRLSAPEAAFDDPGGPLSKFFYVRLTISCMLIAHLLGCNVPLISLVPLAERDPSAAPSTPYEGVRLLIPPAGVLEDKIGGFLLLLVLVI